MIYFEFRLEVKLYEFLCLLVQYWDVNMREVAFL
jgi:hypothetical protein